MRIYNNDPADPAQATDDDMWVDSLKANQFVLRDSHSFGSPRVGGLEKEMDWARSYEAALGNHTGKSWRIVNNKDPVTAVPPVVPFISTWNHVDNGVRIFDDGTPPEQLLTEVGTQPGVSIKPWNLPYHFPMSYFPNLYRAATGIALEYDYVQALLDEAKSGPAEDEDGLSDETPIAHTVEPTRDSEVVLLSSDTPAIEAHK